MDVDRRGLAYTFIAFGIWGSFPFLMHQLLPAGALEITAHRALWSLGFSMVAVAVARRWRRLGEVLRNPHTFGTFALAALLIAINWTVFVFAVNAGHVAESSFGYYINPLATVLLGVVFLKERLRRAQVVAIGVAGLAVVFVGVGLGHLPWISLALAASFSLYSLVKRRIGATVDAITGFTVETLVLAPVAVGVLVFVARVGEATWGTAGVGHVLWLVSTGVWTSGALLIFAAAAARVPLIVIGLVQYVTPTMHFILAITYFGEHMPPFRWVGFALIWVALIIISVDSLRHSRSRRQRTVATNSPS